MLMGNPMPRLSKRQEDEARRQYLPQYEKMKAMLPTGSLIGKKEEMTKNGDLGLVFSVASGSHLTSGTFLDGAGRQGGGMKRV